MFAASTLWPAAMKAATQPASFSSTMLRLRGGLQDAADGRAEEGILPCVADASLLYIGVEIGLEVVVRRHLMSFAAFLMQADPPAFALGVIVLDTHGDDGADAGEGEGH